MPFDLENLERKRRELQEKIEQFEAQKKYVRSALEKLTARYNIGEIRFDQYKEEYQKIFKDKTPEQWTSFYNIQIKSCRAQLDWYDSEIRKAQKTRGRANEKEKNKRKLEEGIRAAESYKERVIGDVQELVKKYNAREISYAQYLAETKKLYNGNEPQKLFDYYDDYVKKAKASLKVYEKSKARKVFVKVFPLVLILGLAMFGLFGFFFNTEFTGLTVQVVDEVHKKTYDLVLNESAVYDFDLPEEGSLHWLKLSGALRGEGNVRVYLDDILILDSEELKSEARRPLTGGVITGFVSEGEGSSEGGEISSEESSGDEQSSSEDENVVEEESSDEGGEGGNSEEVVKDVESEEDNNEEGEGSGGAGENDDDDGNETSQEEPELPSEGNETQVDETNQTSVDDEENSQEETSEEDSETEAIIRFEDYCNGSCDLEELGLNKSSYSLRIEVEGAEFELNEISYELGVLREISEENQTLNEPPVMLKEIPTILIEKNNYYDLDVNEYFTGAVDYYLRQADDISTTVSGSFIRIQPSANFTGERETRLVVVNEFGSYGSNLFNISVFESGNFTEFVSNVTGNESVNVMTKQYKAIINHPVKWVKKVDLENVSEVVDLLLEIPKESENVTIKTGEEAAVALQEAEEYEEIIEEADREEIVGGGITGNVVGDLSEGKGLIARIVEWFRGSSVTGRVISEEELGDEIIEGQESKFVDVEKIVEQTNEREIAIEYYTQAPIATEENLTGVKKVTVSAPDELYYADILAYAILDNSLAMNAADSIQVYWHASYEDAVLYGFVNATYKTQDDEDSTVQQYSREVNSDEIQTEQNLLEDNATTQGSNLSEGEFESNVSEDGELGIANGSSFLTGFAVSGLEEGLGNSSEGENKESLNVSNYYLISMGREVFDLDGDGMVDYVEWIVPHLSNQTFSIVINSSTAYYGENVTLDNGFLHLVPTVDDPYDSMVLYLPFDVDDENVNGTTHYDFSRSENNGNGTGQTIVNHSGCIYGKCIKFDGNGDYIQVGSSPTGFSSGMDGTITAWIYALDDVDYKGIVSKSSAGGVGTLYLDLYRRSTDYLYLGIGNQTNYKVIFDSSRTIPVGEWHFVMGKWNSTTMCTSIDATSEYCSSLTYPFYNSTSPLVVGRIFNSNSYSWNGSIDEVMIFNQTLTTTQIQNIYNNQSARYPVYEQASVLQFNITSGQNTVNITLKNYTRLVGSNISLGIGHWDVSRGYNLSDNSLISYWSFDESTLTGFSGEVKDKTGRHNGTRNGIVNTTLSGYFNRGVNFPGGASDYISINNYSAMQFNDSRNMTWSFWIKPRQIGEEEGIYLDGALDIGGIEFIMLSTGELSVVEPVGHGQISSGNPLQAGKWNHVAITYESISQLVSIYLNGKYDGGNNFGFTSSVHQPRIGYSDFSAYPTFNGTLDEFLIFNSSLSGGEIKELYVRGRVNWTYSAYQNLNNLAGSTSESRNEFAIDRNSTNIFVIVNLSSGSNKFYTPLVYTTSSVPATLTTLDFAKPILGFVYPTPESGEYVKNSTFYFNLSKSDEYESYSFVEVNRDLIAWIRGDDYNSSGSPIDISSFNHNFSIFGTPNLDAGQLGQAYNFSKNDDERFYIVNSSISSNNFSASFFVKNPGGNAEGDIFISNLNGSGGVSIGPGLCPSQSFIDDLVIERYCDEAGLVSQCILANLDDGLWHSIGLTINDTGGFVMLDGSITYLTACALESSNADIMLASNLQAGKLNGALDEVIIINRSLAAADYIALHNTSQGNYLYSSATPGVVGSINLTGHVVDVNANRNSTSRIFNLDNANPLVTFVESTPENGSYVNESSFEVSVDISDAFGIYSGVDFGQDLVLWMRMDEINSTGHPTDLSSYGNNGTKFGSAVQNSSGYFGRSFSFTSGNSYINISDSSSFNLSSSFSVSAWIKTNSISQRQVIVTKTASGDNTWILEINPVDCGNGRISFYDSDEGYLCSDSTINVGEWTFIVAGLNVDSNEKFLTVNDFETLNGYYSSPDTNKRSVLIGNWESLDRAFNGSIDEVMIFNRSLNYVERLSLYSAADYSYAKNFTSLTNGQVYNFRILSGDRAGNVNRSESYSVGVDTSTPLVSFSSPTTINGSVAYGGLRVNLSTTDAYSSTYSFVDVDRSLILWYDMDTVNASNDPIDIAGKRYNGSKVQDIFSNIKAYRSASGKFGESYRVDTTSNYIKAPTINLNLSKNGFTQSMWFKIMEAPANGQTDYLSYFVAGSSDAHYFRMANAAGVYSLSAYGAVNNNNYTITKNSMTSSQILGWHHFVSVYNKTHMVFYVDGVRIGSNATSSTQASYDFSTNYFGYDLEGKVDEVLLFNRSLNEEEVKSLYDSSVYPLNTTIAMYNLTGINVSYRGHSVDRAGNKNSTELRYATIYGEDEVASCRNLSVANLAYRQTANIVPTTNGACIVINAANITYNGNGYWIRNTTNENPAILVNSARNATIRNVNVTMAGTCDGSCLGTGVYLNYSNYSRVENSRFENSYWGVILTDSSYLMFLNNIHQNEGVNIYESANTANVSIISSNFSNATISTHSLDYLILGNNTFYRSDFYADSGGFNKGIIENNLFYGQTELNISHINFLGSVNSTIRNNVFRDCGQGGNACIVTEGIINTKITNNSFVNGIDAIYFSQFNFGLASNLTYLENNHFENISGYSILYDASLGGKNFLIYNNSFGEIRWTNTSFLQNLTVRGNLTFPGSITIANNSAYFNSSAFAGQRINSSANVTLRGLPTSFTNPVILKDGVACGSACYNFTSLNAGTVVFNVTSWSNYSIGSIGPIVSFVSPTNLSKFNVASVFVNVSTDVNVSWCGASINGAANITMGRFPSLRGANATISSLAQGWQQVIVSCNDSFNYYGASPTYLFLIDSVVPIINFTSPTPANGSSQNDSSIFVNVSVNDSNLMYGFTNLDKTLLGWWRFDRDNLVGENATWVYDWSGRGNNGTVEFNSTQHSSGRFGGAFSFDGFGDSIRISSGVMPIREFTISVWILDLSDLKEDDFISQYSGASDSGRFAMWTNPSTNIIQWRIGSTTQTGPELSLNNWYMVTFSRNFTNGTSLYINGVLNRTSSATANINISTLTYIGGVRQVTSYQNYSWNGSIDEVMIFNRSLSAQEISTLYNASAGRFNATYDGLEQGTHTLKSYVVDEGGNLNQTEERTFTVNGNIPIVTFVSSVSAQNPIENTIKNIEVNFTVVDLNGYADITSAEMNFSRNGVVRRNASCLATSQFTTNSRNFTCNVPLWYFDEAGSWNVSVVARDVGGLAGSNLTTYFTYNLLQAIVTSPVALDFGSAQTTQSNVIGPSTLINNTGNYDVTNISIRGLNLIGSTYSNIIFEVGNFSVGNSTSGSPPLACNTTSLATRLVNGSYVNITGVSLPRGNHSVNDGSTGQEVLYYCIPQVPALTSQQYTTSAGGWIIRIALAVFVVGGRRKKKVRQRADLDEESLLDVLDEKLAEKYGIGLDEVLATIKTRRARDTEEIMIPIDIFRQEIGAAESLCKYLKENRGLNFSDIARVINRDPRTVWINYTNASRKISDKIEIVGKMTVSSRIFRDRNTSISEALVYHLKTRGLKNSQIAKLLDKDPRNVWTLYSRAVKKLHSV